MIDANVTRVGHLLVSVDGNQITDTAVNLPPNVLVGFTACTCFLTDNHTIGGVKIAY